MWKRRSVISHSILRAGFGVPALPSHQNRVPMMAPEPPADFVKRPVELGALKQKLLDLKGDAVAISAALNGARDYGQDDARQVASP
jgi:hypothetical protein